MKLRYKIVLIPFVFPLLILGASTYALADEDVSVSPDFTSKGDPFATFSIIPPDTISGICDIRVFLMARNQLE